MNTDDIEVCVTDPSGVLVRVNAALDTTLELYTAVPDMWWKSFDPEYGMSLSLSRCTGPIGYDGPTSWRLELRGCWIDRDDERNLAIRRWIVGYLWDALAAGTDWHLIWWSDDQPDDGIVRERRSQHGTNMPSLDEQMAQSDRYLERHSEELRSASKEA